MFHKHMWYVEGEKFNPRDESLSWFDGRVTEDTYMKIACGFTVMTQRCVGCDLRKTEHVIGRTNGAL